MLVLCAGQAHAQRTGELMHRGELMLKQNLPEEASVAFQQAAELDPSNAQAIYNRGIAVLARGDRTLAADLFREADRVGASDRLRAKARYNLGVVLFEQSRAVVKDSPEEARKLLRDSARAFRGAYRLDPDEQTLKNIEIVRRTEALVAEQIELRQRLNELAAEEQARRAEELRRPDPDPTQEEQAEPETPPEEPLDERIDLPEPEVPQPETPEPPEQSEQPDAPDQPAPVQEGAEPEPETEAGPPDPSQEGLPQQAPPGTPPDGSPQQATESAPDGATPPGAMPAGPMDQQQGPPPDPSQAPPQTPPESAPPDGAAPQGPPEQPGQSRGPDTELPEQSQQQSPQQTPPQPPAPDSGQARPGEPGSDQDRAGRPPAGPSELPPGSPPDPETGRRHQDVGGGSASEPHQERPASPEEDRAEMQPEPAPADPGEQVEGAEQAETAEQAEPTEQQEQAPGERPEIDPREFVEQARELLERLQDAMERAADAGFAVGDPEELEAIARELQELQRQAEEALQTPEQPQEEFIASGEEPTEADRPRPDERLLEAMQEFAERMRETSEVATDAPRRDPVTDAILEQERRDRELIREYLRRSLLGRPPQAERDW